MLAFNHLLAGSIVAVVTPAPLVPFVALTSHFLLDLTPHAHGEEPPYSRFLKTQIVIDAVICAFIIPFVLWLFPSQWLIISIGMFFSFLPDTLFLYWRKGGPQWFQRFLDWAHWIQWGERSYGWIFDAFYAMLMIITLFSLAGKL